MPPPFLLALAAAAWRRPRFAAGGLGLGVTPPLVGVVGAVVLAERVHRLERLARALALLLVRLVLAVGQHLIKLVVDLDRLAAAAAAAAAVGRVLLP